MIARIRRRLDGPAEAGLTLIELLIYSAFLVVILAISGSVLITTLRSEVQVRGLAETSSSGQLISRSVEEGVRNSSDILASTIDADGQLLRARVANGTTAGVVVWQCQAWYYSIATGAVYWKVDNTAAIAGPSDPADPTADGWILLSDGVSLAAGATQFFGSDGTQVVLRFVVSANDIDLVLIPNTVVKRLIVAGGTGPATCF